MSFSIKNFFTNNKKGQTSTPIAFGLNKADQYTYKGYKDLFLSNYCVNRAVTLIASNISNMKLEVTQNDQILDESHWILNLLKNPSHNTFDFDFIEQLIIQYLIYGNVFMFLDNNSQLSLLDVNDIGIFKQSGDLYYEFLHNNEKLKIKISDKNCNFGHLKNFNPNNSLYGYSFLEPIKSSALLYQYIDDYNLSSLQNGARPSGILTIQGGDVLTKEEAEEIKAQFYKEYSGENQAGKVIFLTRAFDWQPLSGSIKDMDYTDASRRTIRSIASGLGVPAILIGDLSLAGESSRNNLEALLEVFEKTTLDPLSNKISQFFTMFFNKIEPGIIVKLKKQNINFENNNN